MVSPSFQSLLARPGQAGWPYNPAPNGFKFKLIQFLISFLLRRSEKVAKEAKEANSVPERTRRQPKADLLALVFK